MKKVLLALSAFISLFWISSCGDIGLGEIVDIDAPELTLTKMIAGGSEKKNFGTTLYTKKNVTFQGSAWDNTGIERVYAEVKWLGESDYKFLKNASCSGGEWSLNISFEKEGACWLRIVSEDKKRNYGSKTAKVISLFVDENAPVGEAWYIDRLVGGIQYNLQAKESLEDILKGDKDISKLSADEIQNLLHPTRIEGSTLSHPSNIDVAQNVEFKICSSFNDAAGVSFVSISIWDEYGNKLGVVEKTAESSNYAPQFIINSTTVPNLPSSGINYLQIRYNAGDIVTDPGANTVSDAEVSMGWFIWWPESDNPRCYISQETDQSIKLHINDSMNVTIFDDDGFKSGSDVECTLYDSDGKISKYKDENGVDKERRYIVIPEAGQRECSIIVSVPGEVQTMQLKSKATDKFEKILDKLSYVLVTDENHPTLIITSPENNQIPTVSGDTLDINFAGITLDSSGCKYLKFVWVPDSVADKKTLAKKWLDSNASSVPVNPKLDVIDGTGEFAGLKLYNVKLSDPTDEGGLNKQTFNFTQSLTGDFGTDVNNEKYFYIRLIRKDNNYIDTELKLAPDNIKPEIELVNPAVNMGIIDKDTEGFVLKYKAKKSTGVKIDEGKYKIEYISPTGSTETVSGHYNTAAGVYESAVISKDTLTSYYNSSINPKYKLYAEDILGNTIDGTYEFIISSLPQIKSISSSASVLCKAGDNILINVSFSKPVTLSSTSSVKLKLKNINGGSAEADYESGNGSTTLVFKYTVKNGDKSDGLEVDNTADGPTVGIDEETAHMKVLPSGENLQDKKQIKIDGVAPKVMGISISTDAVTENKNGEVEYLKEGRTVTAKVIVDDKVTVQGTPKFKFAGLELTWQSISSDGKTITFSKKIIGSDTNGLYSFDKANCIEGLSSIKDEAGNPLSYNSSSVAPTGTNKITVDTVKPEKPLIVNAASDAAFEKIKYMNAVTFKVKDDLADIKTEYNENGGTGTWKTYSDYGSVNSTGISISNNVTLVVRMTDYAGNISDYSDSVSLEIQNNFPNYTVECTNADKNYKSGTLTFKVYFASPVNIASDSDAKITLSKYDQANDKFGGTTTANIVSSSKGLSNVSEATFEYTIKTGDLFSLNINKDGVNLDGITDLYGATQNSKHLDSPYTRTGVKVDTIPPVVKKMTPGGYKATTTDGKKIYENGKEIVLEFDEPVKVNTGKIYLRQTAGWAIPPLFTASDFQKVLSAVKATGNTKIGNLTGTEILYMDGKEDYEWLFKSDPGPANDIYHGTGQFIGPYKQSSYGLDENNKPDTSTKYVLDYDMDIWGNNGLKFGPTFNTGNSSRNLTTSAAGQVVVKEGAYTITTANIRSVLESIQFHERYMNVNSTSVSIDGTEKNKVTINVPKGFLNDDALPLGREWELVIEKGAFMDETGNLFGYEPNGTKTKSDSRQATNGESDTSKTWSRQRSSVSDADSIKPLVLIQDGTNASFLSSGVAKPAIRVDRYSYNIGIKQPSESGGVISNNIITTTEASDVISTTTPTAKIRVRIDCETPNAVVRYTTNMVSNKFTYNSSNVPQADENNNGNQEAGLTPDRGTLNKFHDVDLVDVRSKDSWSYWTTTTISLPEDPTGNSSGGNSSEKFLGGNGDYTKSCKEFIKAKAWANNDSSAVEKEGIFQSVIHIVAPWNGRKESKLTAENNKGHRDVSIRGTTGFAGEPSISPFPLRDSWVGSPYLRRAFRVGNDYYWVSYELLIGASFSNYCSDGTKYDWSRSWGYAETGEFTRCINMRRW